MSKSNIRYEAGTYRPWTKAGGWMGPKDSLSRFVNRWYGLEAISYHVVSNGCTLPEPLPEYFYPPALDPVGQVGSTLSWSWGHDVEGLEDKDPFNHYFYDYWIEQTLRVDRTHYDIEIHRHGPRKNLIVGFAVLRGVKTLSVFLFEEPDSEGRFAKLSLIRFPGRYIEDEVEQRMFLGHFLKHWWKLKPDPGSPFIFHNQKDGQ